MKNDPPRRGGTRGRGRRVANKDLERLVCRPFRAGLRYGRVPGVETPG